MGKILGISDLPVSTIISPFNENVVPKPNCEIIKNKLGIPARDVFISKTKKPFLQSFINMRNGIGRLMKHSR